MNLIICKKVDDPSPHPDCPGSILVMPSSWLLLFLVLYSAVGTVLTLSPPAGPKPLLHLPALQCDPLECRWVLLLRCGHSFHVGHIHSYLSVHHQKGELHERFSHFFWTHTCVRWIKKLSKFSNLYFFVLFQQYIMLHDMVATHSTVRVSVCRANNGLLNI